MSLIASNAGSPIRKAKLRACLISIDSSPAHSGSRFPRLSRPRHADRLLRADLSYGAYSRRNKEHQQHALRDGTGSSARLEPHLGTDFIAIMKCPYLVGKFACLVSEFLM
jgi:hypothetical protein